MDDFAARLLATIAMAIVLRRCGPRVFVAKQDEVFSLACMTRQS